jgi:hypothetical protein
MGFSLCACFAPGSTLVSAPHIPTTTTGIKILSRFHPELPEHGHLCYSYLKLPLLAERRFVSIHLRGLTPPPTRGWGSGNKSGLMTIRTPKNDNRGRCRRATSGTSTARRSPASTLPSTNPGLKRRLLTTSRRYPWTSVRINRGTYGFPASSMTSTCSGSPTHARRNGERCTGTSAGMSTLRSIPPRQGAQLRRPR